MNTYQIITLTITSIIAIIIIVNMIKTWFDLKKMEKDYADYWRKRIKGE